MILIEILIAVLLVSVVSFVGAFTLYVKAKKLSTLVTFFVSFAAGAMSAAALFDLIPEAIKLADESILIYTLAGIIAFLILEKFLYWYHCHGGHCIAHTHEKKKIPKSTGLLNLFGDGLHNFLDGAAIAAAFIAEPTLGWITTLAVALHEIPQEFGDYSILLYSGFSRAKALFFNFVSALTAILGALIAYFFATTIETAIPVLLAFSAGGFIYIALADLIPALHHENKFSSSIQQVIWFILGTLIIWTVATFFPA